MKRFTYFFTIPLISGILLGLSYPIWLNVPTGILAWFALVPMLLAVRDVSTFKTFFLQVYPIVFISTYILGAFVFSFSFLAGLFTCFSQTIFTFLPLIFHYFIQKRLGWRRSMWLLPAVWTVGDWLHHLTPHSFQVSSIAYTQTTVLWFAQLADVFGMWGITFWVVAVNVSIALTWDNLTQVSNLRQVGSTAQTTNRLSPITNFTPLSILPVFLKKWAFQGILLFGLPLLYAFWSNINLPNDKQIKVALVQTNNDNLIELDAEGFNERVEKVFQLSNTAAQSEPDLMVLPESAMNFPILRDKETFSMLCSAVNSWGTSLSVGFPDCPDTTDFLKQYNSAIVITPQLAKIWDSAGISTAQLKVYRKQNPLPYVEFIPYWAGKKGTDGAEVLRGSEPYIFSLPDRFGNNIKTSALICWEQMFPETQAELVELGAQFITQMNNDGWFGNSPGEAILLNMNRLRAIENRRSIARASNIGISAFIDPFGQIQKTLEPHIETTDTEGVYLNEDLTFFTRYKNWFPKFCCLIVLGLMVFVNYSKQ